jgi:DNA-binding NarL/FixJ family response regulator
MGGKTMRKSVTLLSGNEGMLSSFSLPEDHLMLDVLTPRECEVAILLTKGMMNQEIADILGISLNTAKWHAKRALQKLGARNRAQLAVWWREQTAAPVTTPPAAPQVAYAAC